MNGLNIERRRTADVTILDLHGDVTIGEGGRMLDAEIKSLVEHGASNILINLARVVYVDSCGLGHMISGYHAVKRQGGELKLVNLTQRVRDLLVITKLLTIFDTYSDEADAIRSYH